MNRQLIMEKPVYQYAKLNFPLPHRGRGQGRRASGHLCKAQLLLASLMARAAGYQAVAAHFMQQLLLQLRDTSPSSVTEIQTVCWHTAVPQDVSAQIGQGYPKRLLLPK